MNKTKGMTSHQVVKRLRNILRDTKIGHAGTLDPLATGVLPMACGQATKTIAFIMNRSKEYTFRVRWGEERTTHDSQGEIISYTQKRPTKTEIQHALPLFCGQITQVPPLFSAIKIQGKRAYALARQGKTPNIPARQVTLDCLQLLDIPDADHADFWVVCGKGFYIRSLAHNLACHLGTLGYVTEISRHRVGNFTHQQSLSLETLEQYVQKKEKIPLISIQEALHPLPTLPLTPRQAQRISQGQSIVFDHLPHSVPDISQNPIVLALCYGREVGLVTAKNDGTLLPLRIFVEDPCIQ